MEQIELNDDKFIVDKEVWRPVKGFEGLYEVSNLGNVDSLNNYRRKQKRKRLKVRVGATGYGYVTFRNKMKSKSTKVHRVVAMAFIPNPQNLPQINHKDENKLNNQVENLEWCDAKYNLNYGTRKKRVFSKLSIPIIQMTIDGKYIKEYNSISEAARETGSRAESICSVCSGKMDKTNGFKWMYANKEKAEASNLFKKERKERTIKNRNKVYENRSRPVVQMSLSGDFIKEYRSIRVAGKETGINPSCIQGVCYHRRKTTNGYIFKFKDEII